MKTLLGFLRKISKRVILPHLVKLVAFYVRARVLREPGTVSPAQSRELPI